MNTAHRVPINREFGYSGVTVLLAIFKVRPKIAAPIGRDARIRGEFKLDIFELRTI